LINLTGWVTKTGQLQIGNSPPSINYIFLDGLQTTDTASDVVINPVTNGTKSLFVKAWITDLNGDCNTFTSNNGTAYLCNGTKPCNSTSADHTVSLNYNATDGQWGTGNRYCNMTGTTSLQFFEINGTWKVNVTLTDAINNSNMTKNWTYNELRAFTYPPTGNTINMGILNLGQWNNGTAGDLDLNSGNIIINLLWNATDFTGQSSGNKINTSGTNNTYIIDDDTSSPDDTGNIPQAYINQTQKTFTPASGLLRCSSVGCGNTNATFNAYWHINIPSGLSQDTYTNTIQIETQDH
jgi:hypothetical protein